jgi:hypothetical protein
MATTEIPDPVSTQEAQAAKLTQEIQIPKVVEASADALCTTVVSSGGSALVVRFPHGNTSSVRVSYNVERHRRRIENFQYNRRAASPELDD